MEKKWRHDNQGLIQLWQPCESQIVRWIRWIRVFRRTKSYLLEKKWRHDKQGLIQQDAYSGVNSACRENRQELDIRLSIYSGRGKHA